MNIRKTLVYNIIDKEIEVLAYLLLLLSDSSE